MVVGNKCTHYRKSKGAKNTLHFARWLWGIQRNALLSWPLHSPASHTCFTYTRQLSFYLFHSSVRGVSRPQGIITTWKKLLYILLFRGNSIKSNSIIMLSKNMLSYHIVFYIVYYYRIEPWGLINLFLRIRILFFV